MGGVGMGGRRGRVVEGRQLGGLLHRLEFRVSGERDQPPAGPSSAGHFSISLRLRHPHHPGTPRAGPQRHVSSALRTTSPLLGSTHRHRLKEPDWSKPTRHVTPFPGCGALTPVHAASPHVASRF